MSLIFPRVARNLAKAGFYPTDDQTVSSVTRFLSEDIASGTNIKLYDPCCGAGKALSDLQISIRHLYDTETFGVEYDGERAYQAKEALDRCIHADLQDCIVSSHQFSLLWLNPPYGDEVSDSSDRSFKSKARLEKSFFKNTYTNLVFGGLMILTVPAYSLDKDLCTRIARSFTDIYVRKAAVDTFRQIVLFGVRRRTVSTLSKEDIEVRDYLAGIGKGEIEIEPISTIRTDEPRYSLPSAPSIKRFESVSIDSTQLSECISNHSGLWPEFETLFGQSNLEPIPPLCSMSKWHTALALASGQLSGLVTSSDGRKLLVRGSTQKVKKSATEIVHGPKGKTTEVVTKTDVFVPAITGIDVTPTSTKYGDLVQIR